MEERVALKDVQVGHLWVPAAVELLPNAFVLGDESGRQDVSTGEQGVDGVEHFAAVSSTREFVFERGHAQFEVVG